VEGAAYLASPVGELLIRSEKEAITTVHFVYEGDTREPVNSTPVIEQCIQELDEYFERKRKYFTVPINPHGTEFQIRVWNELTTIPFGKTCSYSELSIQIGNLKSIRAVGLANGQNPIVIIIPCHRVIGKDGSLVGYGGGLERKSWLLRHEGVLTEQLEIF